MQKKRNLRLLIILFALTVTTVVTYFVTRPADRINVSREIFSYEDPTDIDRVTFVSQRDTNELTFENNRWEINHEYKADPQRVSVLFAILKQMRIRRKVSRQQQDSIARLMEEEGVKVAFYQGDDVKKEFLLWGDENQGATYIAQDPKSQPYIVEIPGYRSFLAGIFLLDDNGWRDPLVFKMNWAHLVSVQMNYPQQPKKSFKVIEEDRHYKIEGMSQTDSTRLTDFLDDVSLLFANDYLNQTEVDQYADIFQNTPEAVMIVKDISGRSQVLELFEQIPNTNEIPGRVDSVDYVVFNAGKIRQITRPRNFFVQKKVTQ